MQWRPGSTTGRADETETPHASVAPAFVSTSVEAVAPSPLHRGRRQPPPPRSSTPNATRTTLFRAVALLSTTVLRGAPILTLLPGTPAPESRGALTRIRTALITGDAPRRPET